jgi:alanyl-tRNA synthetase
MKSPEIRQLFFDYFKSKNHTQVPSSSLIPAQDPTLLFANAGMNQFKDLFLGKEKRSYTKAVSIQKCVRAGGKHNDLDNVGFTKRHLTFFEMMGNFSFGDYFKKEAIQYAWECLTVSLKLPKDKLYASVFQDDEESYQIWHKVIGLPETKIIRLGAADNFWQMGDTGPCGPCTEIYIDQGPAIGCGKPTCAPGCSCDRFLEIWNNVFMQFDRQADGTLVPLKQTGVDTGMGLERLCAVIQGKQSIFHTDLFEPIIQAITGKPYATQEPKLQAAFHVLADHIRSSALIIADGGAPSNEGRGYVLRKIIRRAALFAQKISTSPMIFVELVDPLIQTLGNIYPELVENKEKIKQILTSEVDKFASSLIRGQGHLEDYFAKAGNKIIEGAQAFKLYDTYGFPLELIRIIAHERGFEVDIAGFKAEMEKQRAQSGKKVEAGTTIQLPADISTTFTGYQETQSSSSIIALITDNALVDTVSSGTTCWVIAQKSPFYVECGGQISDQGWVEIDGKKTEILDLKKFNSAIGIKIAAPTNLKIGTPITQQVNVQRRTDTMKNHTATHLLQAALIQVLGKSVKQSGSLVDPNYLRFDFTFGQNPTPEELQKVETLVNQQIMANTPVSTTVTTYDDAVKRGVIAFFGEKYNPESVRVVEVPGFSAELCGGTHVRATGDIGSFKITEISALAAGTRRLVAVTGPKAIELFQASFNTVKTLATDFKVPTSEVITAAHKQQEAISQLQTELKQLKRQLIQNNMTQWLAKLETVGSVPYLFLEVPNASGEELKEISQALIKAKPGFYFLISSTDVKSTFFATISPDLSTKLNLKNLQAWLPTLGLRGGGSNTLVQGGGPRFDHSWPEKIKGWLSENQG